MLEDFSIIVESDASPFSDTCYFGGEKLSLDLSNQVIKLSFFLFGSASPILGHKSVWLPNAPSFGSRNAAIHGDGVFTYVCIQSANTRKSGTSPVAVCALAAEGNHRLASVYVCIIFLSQKQTALAFSRGNASQCKAKQEETAGFAKKACVMCTVDY